MGKLLVILFVVTSLFLVGCSSNCDEVYWDSYHQSKLAINYPVQNEKTEDITVEEYNEVLRSDYGLSALDSHQILWDGSTVKASFWFNEDAPSWQIRSAWEFAYSKFIMCKTGKYSFSEYDLWLMKDNQIRQDIDSVLCDIYVNEEILIRKSLEKPQSIQQFENIALFFEDRCCNYNDIDKKIKAVKKLTCSDAKVQIGKSILQDVYFVTVDTKQPVNPKSVEKLRKYISLTLYPYLNDQKASKGLVLQLACNSNIYFENIYVNEAWGESYMINDWLNDKNYMYQ